MTYAKRQAWEYANFRHDLLVDGLPINNDDKNRAAEPLISKFSEKPNEDSTLKELFPSNQVKTQVEEVARVKKDLDALKVEISADDLRKQNLLLARILLALSGGLQRNETYVDREFYVSMLAHLTEDAKFDAFKKSLADAFPIAVMAMRYDPQDKTLRKSFEKAYEQALTEVPGEDKWKLAEAFLRKLRKEGATWDKAVAAADKAAKEVEDRTKALDDAKKARQDAEKSAHIADVEHKAALPDKKKAAEDAAMVANLALQTAQAAELDAKKAVDLSPKAGDVAAVAFLQSVRNDNKKTKVPEFVDEVLTETLTDLHDEFAALYEAAFKDAAEGKLAVADAAAAELIRDHRRQAIARFLLAGIEVLDKDALGWLDDAQKTQSMLELPSYKRLINVVGVKAAVDAVNEQQAALASVYSTVNERIAAEKAKFHSDHSRVIGELKRKADEVDHLATRLADISAQGRAQKTTLDAEKARVDMYVKDLTASRGATSDEMKRLYEISEKLDIVRKAIRDAIRSNDRDLRKITELEDEVVYLQQKVVEKEKAEKEKKRRKLSP
jgi:hypothetical protein